MTKRSNSHRDLLGRCAGVDVVVTGVEHDQARRVRQHQPVDALHGIDKRRTPDAAVDGADARKGPGRVPVDDRRAADEEHLAWRRRRGAVGDVEFGKSLDPALGRGLRVTRRRRRRRARRSREKQPNARAQTAPPGLRVKVEVTVVAWLARSSSEAKTSVLATQRVSAVSTLAGTTWRVRRLSLAGGLSKKRRMSRRRSAEMPRELVLARAASAARRRSCRPAGIRPGPRATGVEVGIGQLNAAVTASARWARYWSRAVRKLSAKRRSASGVGRLERERPQRAELRKHLHDRREEPRQKSRLSIHGAERLFVLLDGSWCR